MTSCDTVVVGAGPYGLSIAAHLGAADVDHAIIGSPMESWRAHMPRGMVLKSERFASNLSDADGRYTLERFCASRGRPYARKGVPLPRADFLDYADWFRRNAVPDVWDSKLRCLRRISDGFELTLDDRVVLAKRVILATGHLAFRHFPEALEDLARNAPDLVSHSADHADLAKFAGLDVTVIGCGQSSLETAALLGEHGAHVRVLARAPAVAWDAEFDAAKSLYKRIRWPEIRSRRWLAQFGVFRNAARIFVAARTHAPAHCCQGERSVRRLVAQASGDRQNSVADRPRDRRRGGTKRTSAIVGAPKRRRRANRNRSCHCGDRLPRRPRPLAVPRPGTVRGDQNIFRSAVTQGSF